MKVTHFGVDGFPLATAGWSSGSLSVNSNFNTEDGGFSALNFVQGITANGSNMLLRPIANFAAGSNILLTLDAGPGNSIPSNTIRIHSTASGGGGGSALTVQEVDGSPTDSAVTKLIFPNDSLTISSHEVTIRDVPQAFIGARAYHSTTQSVANTTVVALSMDTEDWDTDGFHSTVTNNSRMTIPAGLGGKYLVIGAATWDTTAAGIRLVGIFKNGATVGGHTTTPGDSLVQPREVTSIVLDLVAGDYVETIVYQNSGGTRTAGSASLDLSNQLTIVKLDSGKVGSGIGARVYNSTTQNVTNTTDTKVTFDTEEFDTDAFHSTSANTSRMTIPTGLGGKYLVGGTVSWDSNTTNTRDVQVFKNGSTRIQGNGNRVSPSPATQRLDFVTVVDLVAGDYVEVNVWQDSGGTRTVGSATNAWERCAFWIMRLDSGTSAYTGSRWGSGTAFPSGPSTNDRFTRTDLGMDFYYDGTRWLSTQLHHMSVSNVNTGAATEWAAPSGTIATQSYMPVPGLTGGSDIWLHDLTTQFLVNGGTALSGSHKWVGIFSKRPTGNTKTTISTVNIDSGSSSVWRTDTQTIDALLNNGTTHFLMGFGWTKTGTPGDLFLVVDLTYRIVAT